MTTFNLEGYRSFGVFNDTESMAVLYHVSEMESEAGCSRFCLDKPDVNAWLFSTNGTLDNNECKCCKIPATFCREDLGEELFLESVNDNNVMEAKSIAYIMESHVTLVDNCQGIY